MRMHGFHVFLRYNLYAVWYPHSWHKLSFIWSWTILIWCSNLRLWNVLKSHCGLFFWWMERFWYCLDICCIWSMWESLFYDCVFHLSSDRSSLMNMCAPIFTKIVSPLSKKNISHITSKRTSDDPNWRSLWAIFCLQRYDYIVYTACISKHISKR